MARCLQTPRARTRSPLRCFTRHPPSHKGKDPRTTEHNRGSASERASPGCSSLRQQECLGHQPAGLARPDCCARARRDNVSQPQQPLQRAPLSTVSRGTRPRDTTRTGPARRSGRDRWPAAASELDARAHVAQVLLLELLQCAFNPGVVVPVRHPHLQMHEHVPCTAATLGNALALEP